MKLRLFLLAFFVYTIICCFLWSILYNAWGKDVTNLGFGYGVLISSIENTGLYKVCNVHYENICFSAHRLPLITYFLIFMKYLGADISITSFVKTIISYSIICISFIVILKKFKFNIVSIIPIILIFAIPKWILSYVEIGMEEPYLIPFLALITAIFIVNDNEPSAKYLILLVFSLVICMWLKHSMLYFPFIFSVIYGIKYKSLQRAFLLISVCLVSSLGIAFFNYKVSDNFTLSSSWEGWNLYKGNNEHSLKYYPSYNLDNLDNLGLIKSDTILITEWDYNNYFKEKAYTYIKSHPMEFLKGMFIKMYVYFLDFGDSGRSLGENAYSNKLEVVNSLVLLLFRIYFMIVLITSIFLAFFKKGVSRLVKINIYFFWAMIISIGGFHWVGFAYQRHFMPMALPVAFIGIFFYNFLFRSRLSPNS
jgi:hypothetical protein